MGQAQATEPHCSRIAAVFDFDDALAGSHRRGERLKGLGKRR